MTTTTTTTKRRSLREGRLNAALDFAETTGDRFARSACFRILADWRRGKTANEADLRMMNALLDTRDECRGR